MEIATDENADAVARAYTAAMASIDSGKPISDAARLIFNVEHMMQEANSGVSFADYFRWAELAELREVPGQLNSIDLPDVSDIVARALAAGFPDGLPASDEAKADAMEWTAEQEALLGQLFFELEVLNGRVMNVLGAYVLRMGL